MRFLKGIVTGFSFLLILFFVSGCGSAPVKPEWTKQMGHAKFQGSLYVVGRSEAKSTAKDAEDSAFMAALAELNLYFGVSVNASMEDIESETNGVYNYSLKTNSVITGAPIKVKKFNKTNVFTEEAKGLYNGYVQIAVPINEASRIAKEIEGLTGYKVVSQDEGCSGMLNDFIKQWGQKKGLKIAASPAQISDSAGINEISGASDTAYFLIVKGEYEEPVQDGKVFIARVRITIRQFSLVEGRELETIVEEMKWGEYDAADAVKKGFKKLVAKMLSEI